jgi:NADH dehydrogenase FAD-containing subunit
MGGSSRLSLWYVSSFGPSPGADTLV